jgi:hypothetical protein
VQHDRSLEPDTLLMQADTLLALLTVRPACIL